MVHVLRSSNKIFANKMKNDTVLVNKEFYFCFFVCLTYYRICLTSIYELYTLGRQIALNEAQMKRKSAVTFRPMTDRSVTITGKTAKNPAGIFGFFYATAWSIIQIGAVYLLHPGSNTKLSLVLSWMTSLINSTLWKDVKNNGSCSKVLK